MAIVEADQSSSVCVALPNLLCWQTGLLLWRATMGTVQCVYSGLGGKANIGMLNVHYRQVPILASSNLGLSPI